MGDANFSKEATRRSATVKTEAGESTLNYYEAGEPTADRRWACRS